MKYQINDELGLGYFVGIGGVVLLVVVMSILISIKLQDETINGLYQERSVKEFIFDSMEK